MESSIKISRGQLANVFKEYANITALLSDQVNQSSNRLYKVIDASADTNISFPSGETKLHAYYEYKETANGVLADYDLVSVPYESSEETLQTVTDRGAVTNNGINLRQRHLSSNVIYGFSDGILIKTNIPETSQRMVVLRITGNGYQNIQPIDAILQFYNYADNEQILASSYLTTDKDASNLEIFVKDGVVCLWFEESNNLQTYSFELITNYGTPTITSVTDEVMPTTGVTRQETVIPHLSWDSSNDGAGSTLDADLLDGEEGSYYLDYDNLINTPTIDLSPYAELAGDNTFTGDNTFDNPVKGVDATIDDHFVTKRQLDATILPNKLKIVASGDYTVQADEATIIHQDTTSAVNTITIPTAASSENRIIRFKCWSKNKDLSESYITRGGSTTTDVGGIEVLIQSDGTNWYKINT